MSVLRYCRYCLALAVLLFSGCMTVPEIKGELRPTVKGSSGSSVMMPKNNKVMLMLGQDLESLAAYTDSGWYPEPAGVSTYLAFYRLLDASFPAYGALGQDERGRILHDTVDWGAGALNTTHLVERYPDAALVVGLNIAEGNQHDVWTVDGLSKLSKGVYDPQIRRLARFFKSLGQRPVYLRIGYEFDGAWNRGYDNPVVYISAYQRIVDVLRQQGVRNVAYVWQASASPIDDVIDQRREDIRRWYPGDDYVDWLGLSWFLAPDVRYQSVATQRILADEILTLARSKGKPVIVAEAAPQGYDLKKSTVANISPIWDGAAGAKRQQLSSEHIWQRWYVPFFVYIRSNADVIRAVTYVNADWDAQSMWSTPYVNGYWGDSRVQTNSLISQKWLDEISDHTFWLHGRPHLRNELTE